jgi:hypothetical protein
MRKELSLSTDAVPAPGTPGVGLRRVCSLADVTLWTRSVDEKWIGDRFVSGRA